MAATPWRRRDLPVGLLAALTVDDDPRPVHLAALREPRGAGLRAHALAVGRHPIGVVVGQQTDVERRVRALRHATAARGEERGGARQVDDQVLAGGAEAHVNNSSTPSTGARWAYSK